jgi:hypothetical protein
MPERMGISDHPTSSFVVLAVPVREIFFPAIEKRLASSPAI